MYEVKEELEMDDDGDFRIALDEDIWPENPGVTIRPMFEVFRDHSCWGECDFGGELIVVE
jgi:hypothetical protein